MKGLDQTSGCHSSRKSLSYLQQARTITRLRNKSSQLGLRCFDVADRTPLAFMSYTHSDDRHDEGRLTQLRERLSGEVGMQTGKDFPIFQDRKDIKWGQAWKERIEQSLIEVTFLIPIITPGFFTSDFCRDELQIFIEREKELKRSDLILPIYYVNTPLLHDENRRGSDELAQLIAARQYADWRDLRLQPFTLPLVGKTLEQLALQIRDALERVSADAEESSKTPPVKKPRARRSRTPKKPLYSAGQTSTKAKTAEGEAVTNVAEATPGPSAKSEPPTRVVDQLHRGDHVTISEAIEAANPGDRILARLGFYQEGLVIDKHCSLRNSVVDIGDYWRWQYRRDSSRGSKGKRHIIQDNLGACGKSYSTTARG